MTASRIDQKFDELRAKKKKAFIAYLTAGYPSLSRTRDLVLALEQSGADIVELGVPFSDPLADGPTIQDASYRALKAGVSLDRIFETVKQIRKTSNIPLALMTYYNPVYHTGDERFIGRCRSAGVDGLIIPDLPPEEAGDLIPSARRAGVNTVFFMAPTTRPDRLKRIAQSSTGFIYYVSLTGVTGARVSLPADIIQKVRAAKKVTSKPVCVGFGVSSREQVRSVASVADGVIVGSAIIKEISKHTGSPDLIPRVSRLVKGLSNALFG